MGNYICIHELNLLSVNYNTCDEFRKLPRQSSKTQIALENCTLEFRVLCLKNVIGIQYKS